MKRISGLILAALAAGSLAGASQARNGSEQSFPRSGTLHVTKECSQYTGLAGSFCTITSSNLKAIRAGSKVVYASPLGGASLDSDLTLQVGRNRAFGHVQLDLSTASGTITFSGGTGRFSKFQASLVVSFDGALWHWDGPYTFRPSDDD